MGEALISRLLALNVIPADAIMVGEPTPARRQFLSDTYGIQTTGDNRHALTGADVVMLAVKPQVFEAITPDVTWATTQQQSLLLSIMAGVPLAGLAVAAPGWPIIRAMPNTPATVGAGVTAIAANTLVTPTHLDQARSIFAAVGTVVDVPETSMDAVTGLSGSGPGYIAVVIEALADGGVAAGLSRAVALQLALQTVRGTAELLQTTQMHPAVLKDRVTSPGGTTIAGIAQLEAAGLRSALITAVQSACDRAKALGS